MVGVTGIRALVGIVAKRFPKKHAIASSCWGSLSQVGDDDEEDDEEDDMAVPPVRVTASLAKPALNRFELAWVAAV